jgi:hypothetical protein
MHAKEQYKLWRNGVQAIHENIPSIISGAIIAITTPQAVVKSFGVKMAYKVKQTTITT